MRVPAEHVQRLGDEVGQRVDVVEAGRAVAVVDQIFDSADVEPGGLRDPLGRLDQLGRRSRPPSIRTAARPGWARQASAGQRSKLSPPLSTSIA